MDAKAKKRVEFTLKHETSAVSALAKLLREKSFSDAVRMLQRREGKIITTGVGKSGFIAMKVAATLTSLGHGAFFLDPTGALHGDSGIVRDGDVVIAFSFSGESPELTKLLKYLKKNFTISIVGITGSSASTLAKIGDTALILQVKEEGCPLGLAPMASTTASLVVGDLLASALTAPETFKKEHFAKFHPGGSLGLSLKKVKEVMTLKDYAPLIFSGATFRQALGNMSKSNLGVIGVVDSREKLVGVITDGDVRRILLKYDAPKELAVRKVMSLSPKNISEEKSLKEALALMEKYKITNLFAVDSKKKLTGILHIHQILESSIS
ncbi:KpsF/GutQ family sugar-phosphate isomerase [bacterium]|nr:KpsF/GutQ family sugar-phosphate isomerase [bacterium]